jgi:hypothetical protein
MPDNAIYYQLAYTAAAVIYVGYAISLVLRRRRLRARAAQLRTGGERT